MKPMRLHQLSSFRWNFLLAGILAASGMMALGRDSILTRPLTSEYSVKIYTMGDGLPDNRVYAADTDPEGYLWLGTQGGVACFDGQRFTRWSSGNLKEFTDYRAVALSVAPDGVVWFASRQELVSFSVAGTRRYVPEGLTEAGFILSRVVADDNGAWLANNHSFMRVNQGMMRTYNVRDGVPHRYVTSLHLDSSGTLWAGTRAGVAKYLADEDRFARAAREPHLLTNWVRAVYTDRHHRLWVLMAEHDLRSRRVGFRTEEGWHWMQTPNAVNGGRLESAFLSEDRMGRIWAAGGPVGLYRCTDEKVVLLEFPEELRGDYPLCFSEDREGNIWIGMENRGLVRLRSKTVRTGAYPEIEPQQAESLLRGSDGTVWIGCADALFRLENGVPVPVPAAPGESIRNVRALMEDKQGQLWAGTRNGLFRLKDGVLHKTFDFNIRQPPKIKALIQTRDGAIWAGTIRGLFRFHKGATQRWTTNVLAEREVRALAEDKEGRVWAAMLAAGINVYEDGVWTHLTEADGLASNFVWDFHLDPDGYLWIATRVGLSVWDGTRVRSFNEVLKHEIDDIVPDDSGRLWFSSPRGICRISRKQLLARLTDGSPLPKVWYYGRDDGLSNLEFSGDWTQGGGIQMKSGAMLFTTEAGLVQIQPEAQALASPPPIAVIEQVTASGRVLYRNKPFTDRRELTPPPMTKLGRAWHFSPGAAEVLEITFTSPAFASPRQTIFHYRLLGVSEEWREVGQTRHATFANLTPGAYLFEVAAENKYGLRSETPARFAFEIEPRFTQTAGFYTLLAGGAGIFLLGFHHQRIQNITRLRSLEAQVNLARQRETLSRAMHDDLGALVFAIIAQASRAQASAAGEVKRALRRLEQLGRELSRGMRDTIWAATPEHDYLAETVAKIRHFASTFLEDAGVEAKIDIPGDLPDRKVSGDFRQGVFLLAKEALNNAVKHSEATEISIEISISSEFTMRITDNGRGFDPQTARSRGRGLKSMRSRAEELKARFELTSQPGQGTRLTISVPLGEPE